MYPAAISANERQSPRRARTLMHIDGSRWGSGEYWGAGGMLHKGFFYLHASCAFPTTLRLLSHWRRFSAKNNTSKAHEKYLPCHPSVKAWVLSDWGCALAGHYKKSCKQHLWGSFGALYTALLNHPCQLECMGSASKAPEKHFGSTATRAVLTLSSTASMG